MSHENVSASVRARSKIKCEGEFECERACVCTCVCACECVCVCVCVCVCMCVRVRKRYVCRVCARETDNAYPDIHTHTYTCANNYCNVLQGVAQCYPVLQCGAVWRRVLQSTYERIPSEWFHRTTQVCCSVWQCAAVCYSVLLRVAAYMSA